MDTHRETKIGIEPSPADDKANHLESQAEAVQVEHKGPEGAEGVQMVQK